MRRKPLLNKLQSAASSALIGAVCGAMFAAFGSAISGSHLGIGATILLTVAGGGWVGRWPGVLIGGVCGILLVGFGLLIGSSAIGVAVTALICAVIGTWLQWAHERWAEECNCCTREQRSAVEEVVQVPGEQVLESAIREPHEKELVPWN